MAIKIQCATCGFQNELGRIFCAQCGQKLDLHDTSMEDLDDRREFELGKWIRWGLASVVLLGGSALLALVFWAVPPTPVFMDAAGSRQVPIKVEAILRALSYNKAMTLDFQEGELNGFLAERAKVRHLKTLTIDLKPGTFELYSSFTWTPATNPAFLAKVKLPVTMSLKGGFQGGVFMPESGRLGHLPLLGRSLSFSTGFFASQLPDIVNAKRVIDALRTVAIEEKRADLTLVPVGK